MLDNPMVKQSWEDTEHYGPGGWGYSVPPIPRTKWMTQDGRGGTHSHFSQQLPLPELTPFLLTQLLSLPTLHQLEPPLHLVLHVVHLP